MKFFNKFTISGIGAEVQPIKKMLEISIAKVGLFQSGGICGSPSADHSSG
jgi:hypothetical protein